MGISKITVSLLNLKNKWLSLVFIIIFTFTFWTIGYFSYVKLEEINPAKYEIFPKMVLVVGVISFLFPSVRTILSEILEREAKNN
jgi:hypothetical protein